MHITYDLTLDSGAVASCHVARQVLFLLENYSVEIMIDSYLDHDKMLTGAAPIKVDTVTIAYQPEVIQAAIAQAGGDVRAAIYAALISYKYVGGVISN